MTSTLSRLERLASGATVTFLNNSWGFPPTRVTRPTTRPSGYLPPRPEVTTRSPSLTAAFWSTNSMRTVPSYRPATTPWARDSRMWLLTALSTSVTSVTQAWSDSTRVMVPTSVEPSVTTGMPTRRPSERPLLIATRRLPLVGSLDTTSATRNW